MAGFDYFILAVLLLSAVAGLIRGFLKEVCLLVAWIAALWLAWKFGPSLEPWMGDALRRSGHAVWAGRGIVFFVVLAVGGIVAALVSHFVRLSLFSATDRLLGFLLGLLRGVLILAIIIVLGQSVKLDDEGWWQNSRLLPLIQPVSQALRAVIGEPLESIANR